jgi:hypothetical protein
MGSHPSQYFRHGRVNRSEAEVIPAIRYCLSLKFDPVAGFLAGPYVPIMAGLKAKRNNTVRARMDKLRASGLAISVSGRRLKPGSREYEKMLKGLVESTSPDELVRGPRRGGTDA